MIWQCKHGCCGRHERLIEGLTCRTAPIKARENVNRYKAELADAKSAILNASRDLEVSFVSCFDLSAASHASDADHCVARASDHLEGMASLALAPALCCYIASVPAACCKMMHTPSHQ
jgi:hypothetical protein